MSSLEPSDEPVDLAGEVRDLTEEVRGFRADLATERAWRATERTWRRRFAWAMIAWSLLFAVAGTVAGLAIASDHGTSTHLGSVIDCNNQRFRDYVNASRTRAALNNRQTEAFVALLGQILKVTKNSEFRDDVTAYIAAADALIATPVPTYPSSACA